MLTTGEGGMILTDDKKVADFIRELRDYTGHKEFKVRYNYKMTDIAAALGVIQLKKLNNFIKKRVAISKAYNHLLKNTPSIILPDYTKKDSGSVFYRYIVKLIKNNPDRIRYLMKKEGIICGYGVLKPLHQLLNLPIKNYPNSEKLAGEVISLPIYPSLQGKDINFICDKFIKLLKK